MTAYRKTDTAGDTIYVIKSGDPSIDGIDGEYTHAELLANSAALAYCRQVIPGPDFDLPGTVRVDKPRVSGQRQLTDAEFSLLNRAKQAEAAYQAFLNEVGEHLSSIPGTKTEAAQPFRSLSLARTNAQQAGMWACNAIARNEPVKVDD